MKKGLTIKKKQSVLKGLLALTMLFALYSPVQSFELIKKIPLPAESFSVDLMGQVYWSDGSALFRLNPRSGKQSQYNNTFLGNIHSWDHSNPLKITAFHKDFNTLVFLDNNLAPIRSPIRLDQLGINRAAGCCLAHDGGFWVINQSTGQIEQYNPELNLVQESQVLSELTTQLPHKPVIKEQNRRLYCLIPQCCALIFDRFGNLERRQPLKNVDNIQILKKNIYYFYKGHLYRMDKDLQNAGRIKLPSRDQHPWDFARMGPKNRLYLLRDQQLYIYKI